MRLRRGKRQKAGNRPEVDDRSEASNGPEADGRPEVPAATPGLAVELHGVRR
ncbi:hypothetical protein HW445_07300, partial [Streptomyces sp. UH6]|nr:hypothetical protein [Streptomyces sp. UH6]